MMRGGAPTTGDLPVPGGTDGPLLGNSTGWLPELVSGRIVEIGRIGGPFAELEWLHSVSLIVERAAEQMVASGLADDVLPL